MQPSTFVAAVVCWSLVDVCVAGRDEARLLNDLFLTGKYNAIERPAKYDDQPLTVYYMIDLQQIIDVDELAQLLHTNLWITIVWSDYKLTWNPADYGNITDVRYPITKLWRPDVLMYNSADEKFDGSYPVNAVIYNDGTVKWIPPGMFKSSCSIDIKWFPFDEQRCEMKFGSWSYNSLKIDLQILDNATEGQRTVYQRNGEWDIIDFPVTRNAKTYTCCAGEFVDLTFQLHIRRRQLFYMVNIMAPCIMMAALTLLTFLIPTEAGSKLSFCVTILLSLTVFLLMVAQALPATSDAVPLIAVYFGVVMLMNAISVSCTVYVLRCHFRNVQFRKMPYWIKKYVNGWLAVILMVKSRDKRQSSTEKTRKGRATPLSPSKSLLSNAKNEDDYSPNLHFHNVNGSHRESGNCKDGSGSLNNNACDTPLYSRDFRLASPTAKNALSPTMKKIFKEMQFITKRMQEKAREEALLNEWRLASKVIDRLMAWLFFAMTTAVALVTLLSAPNAA